MKLKSVFDASEIRSEFESAGINPNFVIPIWKYVIQNPDCVWDEIPSLPSAAYTLLHSKFKTLTSSLHSLFHSSDGTTSKLLIKLQNGAFVEAVIMRYDTRLGMCGGKPRPGGVRSTLCISSQVGCKMGCTFCATGSMGFKSNLTSGEIVEQLVHASRLADIRNIVFMGMGEPLNNYNGVVEAVRVMLKQPFQLSPKRITISTVGVIHAINKLHNDLPGVSLAVSLHAPVQEIRCQIMPAARAFPLQKLMDALQAFQKNSGKVFDFLILQEFLGLSDGNSVPFFFNQVINLIPFNPIGSTSQFKTSTKQSVSSFQKILRETYKIRTTIRKEMGQDISGACGQLVVNQPDSKRPPGTVEPLRDIEDLHL
ncbi:unnamed protein product [Thlaspi arvense]|uniref:Radical SAM core domain-containing protein n=1 Tax=Thlaspi arvense TaxID=13288 RepID=A0AAU9RXV9_THLAR|nr:unnamed protein product [Thlaspi arvense]